MVYMYSRTSDLETAIFRPLSMMHVIVLVNAQPFYSQTYSFLEVTRDVYSGIETVMYWSRHGGGAL